MIEYLEIYVVLLDEKIHFQDIPLTFIREIYFLRESCLDVDLTIAQIDIIK